MWESVTVTVGMMYVSTVLSIEILTLSVVWSVVRSKVGQWLIIGSRARDTEIRMYRGGGGGGAMQYRSI